MIRSNSSLAVFCLLLVAACSAPKLTPLDGLATASATASPDTPPTTPVDTLFVNGQILTMADGAEQSPDAPSAVAVSGDRIVAVGSAELATRYAPRQTIDLAGAALLPGFNDTHIHIEGNPRRYIDLTKVTSIAQMRERVAQRATELGPGEWITGYGWSEDELAEARKPSHVDFADVAPQNPVVLTRAGAHSAVANSLALELAGFNRASSDPENGSLERDSQGDLTGIIRERQDILLALVPTASEHELEASLAINLKALFELGITSLTQATAEDFEIRRWRRVYNAQRGNLPRAAVQLIWPGPDKFAGFNGHSGDGDEHFRLGPLKVFVDGGFTGPAAYTKAPYRNESSYRGKLALTETELTEIVTTAHNAGWQLGIHAIGDAAIELVVDELVRAMTAASDNNNVGKRHYLNHFTVMPSAETMKKMAQHNIWITQQPNFTYTLEGRYVAYLDGDRLETNNALRTPMDHGIFMALSSDILPIGPMVGIYAAVTRRGMSGRVFGAGEALSIREALVGYTRNAAYFTSEEALKGTIEVGKLADFVVLGQNPEAVNPNDLLNLTVEQTWLGGTLVYERTP